MKRMITRPHHNAAVTAILFIIVATALNLVAAEDKTEIESKPDGPSSPSTTTTTKPVTFVAPSARSHNNDGFKPSSFEFEQSMRQNTNQMKFPDSGEQPKVKRQEQSAVVRLFDGPEPGQSQGRVDEDGSSQEGEELDQPAPKSPRVYYDERAHYRDFGSGNAYGGNLPNIPAQDEDNEVEAGPHQYPRRPQQNSQNTFRQDPVVNQYRSSPDKYQYVAPAQTPGNARRPNSAYGNGNRDRYNPYVYETPGSYYGYTPIVNDYAKAPIIASMPYHYPAAGPAGIQSESVPHTDGAHTNLQRQKRGVEYTPVNSDENIEYIPASLLRREHRTDDADPELYDYDDGTPNSYYGAYMPEVKAKNARPTPTPTAVPQSKKSNSNVPNFVPIPTSKTSSGNQDIDPFDLPPQEYDAFQFKSNKETTKSKSLAAGAERTPRVLASTIKSSSLAGSPTSMSPITSSSTPTSSSNTISAPVSSSAKRGSRRRVKPAAGVQVTPTGSTVLALPSGTASTIPPTTQVTTTTMNSRVRHFPIDSEALREFMASAATLPPIEEQIQKQLQSEKKSLNTPTPQQDLFKKDEKQSKQFDLSPQGPIMGLLNAAVEHRQDTDVCQRRALCELAMRGTNPTATRFETFLWALANLTPNAFTAMYDIDDVFQTIRDKNCSRYKCANPNLDIQIQ